MGSEASIRSAPEARLPSVWLRVGAIVLPVLKCALCPACLSIFGSVLAGTRIGLLDNERVHAPIILVALIADFGILGASMRHHSRRGPIALCALGAMLAVFGHFAMELVEYAGFGILLGAGIWNTVLLRRHHQAGSTCCAHGHAHSSGLPARGGT